jgi:hypothetical protein
MWQVVRFLALGYGVDERGVQRCSSLITKQRTLFESLKKITTFAEGIAKEKEMDILEIYN